MSFNGKQRMHIKLKYSTTMTKLRNIHPGEVLREEFLKPMGITAYRLSKDIGIPQTRTGMILQGKRRITADTALRLSKYFGTTAQFWLGLQNDHDLEEEEEKIKEELEGIVHISNDAT